MEALNAEEELVLLPVLTPVPDKSELDSETREPRRAAGLHDAVLLLLETALFRVLGLEESTAGADDGALQRLRATLGHLGRAARSVAPPTGHEGKPTRGLRRLKHRAQKGGGCLTIRAALGTSSRSPCEYPAS